ncbi:MAG: S9 family peptidase [Deltaproteobacteria bacterium]|nr:S9 family peptidase [Deltaproteobacteria bacterium]
MKRSLNACLYVALLVLLLSGCATAPKHPALKSAQLPDLIPLRHLVTNKETTFNYRVSPDGLKLGWIAVKGGRLTVHLKQIGGDKVTTLSPAISANIYGFIWTPDSRRILYWQDQSGNENYHIYLADSGHPNHPAVDLTPFENTRAGVHRIVRTDPDNILIAHNERDKTVFDLYRVNLKTHKQTMVAQNPGDVVAWLTDDKGNLRGRFRKKTNEKLNLEIVKPPGNTWKELFELDFGDSLRVFGFTADGQAVWALSNRGRDRISLVRMDFATGKEKLVYEDPHVDLSTTIISYQTKKPLFAVAFPDYQKLHFFDPQVGEDARIFLDQSPLALDLNSADYDERLLTVTAYTDKSSEYYLFNRDKRQKILLHRNPISRYQDSLATVKPISFKSRDGLTIHGYLTLPKGTSGNGLPMVLLVHGGPWFRDYWGYRSTVQLLANRGYAVLQVNYRGSSGYGRAFLEASRGEFAGKMHTDLIDGVDWAVAKGIADPQKIAIFGFSYGGYAALVGLSFTPDIFACGVDVFGISNLISFTRSVPKYWKNWMPYWYKYVGNPTDPEDRRRMKAQSPLFRVDQIKRPLLIVQGANDTRVKQQESDQIVTAMREANKEVEYILFKDEGHSIRNWQNRIIFYRKLEDFLAEHLGGRSAGFDFYELAITSR